jgi:hypothetical protein
MRKGKEDRSLAARKTLDRGRASALVASTVDPDLDATSNGCTWPQRDVKDTTDCAHSSRSHVRGTLPPDDGTAISLGGCIPQCAFTSRTIVDGHNGSQDGCRIQTNKGLLLGVSISASSLMKLNDWRSLSLCHF